jgi:chromosome segregation ATPase
MENLYSWLIIFSGATITLLGSFLFTSERELRNKRRELDEFKRKQTAKPIRPSTETEHAEAHLCTELITKKQELTKEIAALSSKLEASHKTLEEYQNEQRRLLTVQAENQQLYAQLQTSVAESKRQIGELIANNKALLEESDALSSNLAVGEKRIEELRSLQHDSQLENQQLLAENQRLQREITDFHEQLETAQSQLGETAKRQQEASVCNEKLQNETRELKQQLEQSAAAIDELRTAERRSSEIHSENQKLRLENQGLQRELETHRVQSNVSEARLQELAHQNQEISDRCARLEAEVADFQRQLEDSQSKAPEIEITPQQLANVESRELIYKEQQQKLEALIVDLERELSEGKNQVQALEDTHERLRETDRVCQGLADENRRLGEEISRWQERLAASEENQRQVSILRQQLDELQSEHARLIAVKRLGSEELAANGEAIAVPSCLASDCDGAMVLQSAPNVVAALSSNLGNSSAVNVGELAPSEIAISETKLPHGDSSETSGRPTDHVSSDPAPEIHATEEEETSRVDRTSVKRKWRFGAVPAIVIVIASIVTIGILGTRFLMSKESAVTPETSPDEYTADPISIPQTKSASRLRGTFETVRPTRVYGGPSENSPLIANIGPGMKLNVVDSNNGWLEVRSKHGRPPGFIRQEAAVRIGQN